MKRSRPCLPQKEPEWSFVKRQLAVAYGRNGQLADADVTLAEEAVAKDNTRAARMAKRALSYKSAADHIKATARDILSAEYPATTD